MLARENPFRTELVLRHRYEFLANDSMDALTQRFESQGYVGAIVGKKGRGKTTLLEDFCVHLQGRGHSVSHLRLSSRQSADSRAACRKLLATAGHENIIVLDGAEQLGWLPWRLFRRQAKRFQGLLVTTHHSGRLPELIRCETQSSLLHEAVHRIAPSEYCHLQGGLNDLFAEHDGNLRDCFRSLFDRYARS